MEYSHDHKPILEQKDAVGHAVRFMYMCSGVTDIAAFTGDDQYGRAARRLWESVVDKKLYITGGVGAQGFGEGFSADYELPNLSAYCETCASIGHVFFNHRLSLLYGDAKYVDLLERTLYNGVLAAVSMEGNRFFYPNPLASRGSTERSAWFDCACCPPNIARILSSVPGYIYALEGRTLYVNLYIASAARVHISGTDVRVSQETRYPWEGNVRFNVDPEHPSEFTLSLRIPGWARNVPVSSDLYSFADYDSSAVNLRVNGKSVLLNLEKGYARLKRNWNKGDVVELLMPMPVRRILANERVGSDRGRVALQRGPIVYCAEGADHPDGKVLNIFLPDESELQSTFHPEVLNGLAVVQANAFRTSYAGSGSPFLTTDVKLTAIPYYAWAHRGRSQMTVWIARDASHTEPDRGPSLAAKALIATSGGEGAEALNDGQIPATSSDRSHGCFTWVGGKDTLWVQYDFGKTVEVSEASVYWFDDSSAGSCRVPKSWRILARIECKWEPVYSPLRAWGTLRDRFNQVDFETARTDAVRLEVIPSPGKSAGILEWDVD